MGSVKTKNVNYHGRFERKKTGEVFANEKLHLYKDNLNLTLVAKLSLANFKLYRYDALF